MKKIVVLTASVLLYTTVLFGQCSVSITGQINATCFMACNGIIMATASGGTAPYTYMWSNGGTAQNNYGLCAGTYIVTISDALGCTSTASASITQPIPVNAAISAQTNVLCNGGNTGSATVTPGGGTPGYTYIWTNGQTFATASGLTAGTWTVTVTDNNGCTATATVTISQPTHVTASISAQTNVSCNGGSDGTATVTPGGGTPPYSYLWNDPAPAQTTANCTGLTAGTWTVTVTDNNGCTATTTVTITQPAAITANAGTDQTICSNIPVSLNGSVSVATGGQWSSSGTGTFNPDNTTLNAIYTPSATDIMAGVVTLTLTTTGNGICSAVTDQLTITIMEAPLAIASNNGPVCEGASLLFTGTGGIAYLWSGPNSFSSNIQNPSIPGATTLMSGTYSLTVTDYNGCTGTVNTTVTVNIPASVNGTVVYSGGYIGAGDANVMLYGTGPNGHHQLVDSVLIGSNGSFSLQDIQDGDYYLYVKLINNSAYQHVHNTYYDSTYKWFEAQVINLTCGNDTSVTINMFETTPPSQGSGQIDGTVTLMSSKGAKTPGEPVEGAEIFVEEEPNDEPIASSCSDANGIYGFDLIPEGIYNIYVDIPGFPLFETYIDITVTPSDTMFQGLNFYIDTTIAGAGIYTEDIVWSPVIVTFEFTVEFFPNPVKNELSVFVLNQNEEMNIEVLNINGQSLYKSIFKEQTTIDMTEFSKGSYFIKIQSGKTVVVKKIIKQ